MYRKNKLTGFFASCKNKLTFKLQSKHLSKHRYLGIKTRLHLTEIDCGTPPAMSNAHTENLTATTFMATAQYACDEGYKMDVIGAPLVCSKSANWLGEPVVCSGRCLC